jgi:hypothetical protein
MTDSVLHLRDDQLLLYAGGEVQSSSMKLAAQHLENCSQCQARLAELENTLAEVSREQHLAVDQELPSAVGPRALLKAQISDMSARTSSVRESSKGAAWAAASIFQNWRRTTAVASLALLAIFVADLAWHRMEPQNLAVVLAEEPNVRFTPGAVVAVTQNQVCSDSAEMTAVIPLTLKTKVLQLYGVAKAQSDAYEVDYLITPELGGATDIRNLWPEPYDHTVWNAHVKDRLENRLRELVCHGDLDLATAQHDISTDWIAAYRKYFHADVPFGSS